MLWRLVYSRAASRDFDSIYGWVIDSASRRTADRYAARLQTFCRRLTRYPKRAEVRDDILPGVRLIGFEKSVTVVFVIDESAQEVRILRLLYRGRRLEI